MNGTTPSSLKRVDYVISVKALSWTSGLLVFNSQLLASVSSVSTALNFVLLVLLGLDLLFLLVAELLVRLVRH